MNETSTPAPPHIAVRDLTMAYGSYVVMRKLTFDIKHREIFVIMGGSGCGKSTLLRHLIGLLKPAAGTVYYDGEDFTDAEEEKKRLMLRTFGQEFEVYLLVVQFDGVPGGKVTLRVRWRITGPGGTPNYVVRESVFTRDSTASTESYQGYVDVYKRQRYARQERPGSARS